MICKKWMLAIPVALFVPPLLAGAGCARAPGGSASSVGSQIIVSMTVAGRIRPDYSYFVLFNTTNSPTTSTGPIPVVAAPWGNGFAAGQFTQFVRYDATQGSAGYGVYSVVPNTNLRSFQFLGTPIQSTPVSDAGQTIQFKIPLAQLATSSISADQIRNLQINFIATNSIPADANSSATKLFDALGDARQTGGVNDPITIATLQSHLYQNSDSISPEPSGDVTQAGNGVFQTATDPDLDIVNWTVEVRN